MASHEAADTAPSTARTDAFISYAREDRPFVAALREQLDHRGKTAWVDLTDIEPAADWRARVRKGIEASKAFVVVLSPEAVDSPVCREELDHAIDLHKRLIPIVRRDVDPDAVPAELSTPNWVWARQHDDQAVALAQLIEALETDLEWRDAHAKYALWALEWDKAGRPRGSLLRGSELRSAQEWLLRQGGHRERPTRQHEDYILASRRWRARLRQIIFGTVLVALVVAVGLAILALIQRREAVRQAHTAQSRELAASAIAQLDADPGLSLLLAVEGAGIAATDQTATALRLALSASHLEAVIRTPAEVLGPPVLSRDGRFLVQAGADRVARIWDLRSGRLVAQLRGHRDGSGGIPDYASGGPRLSATFSADGRRVGTAGDDGTVRVWDWRAERAIKTLRPAGGAGDVAFSPDGRVLAVGTLSDYVLLLDWRTGRVERRLAGLEGDVQRVAFDPTGAFVLGAGLSGTARVWDVDSGRALPPLRVPDNEHLADAAFSPDASWVATATGEGTIDVWEWRDGERRVQFHAASGVPTIAFGRDSVTLATATSDGKARIWDWAGRRVLAELRGHRGALEGVAMAPDGSVFTSGGDRTIRRWRVRGTGIVLPGSPDHDVTEVEFSPNGRLVATAGPRWDGLDPQRVAEVWDMRSRRRLAELQEVPVSSGDHRPWLQVAFSPDGQLVAGASDSGDVHIWNWRRGGPSVKLRHDDHFADDVSFSSDGGLLATTASDGMVRLWQWRARRLVARLRPSASVPVGFYPVAVHPDGEHIAARDADGAVRVWEWRRGRVVARLALPAAASDLKFDITGRLLAVAGQDGVARVWDWRRGATLAELRGQSGLLAVNFNPDGRLLLTAEEGGAAAVWEWEVEQRVAEFREARPVDLDFDPGLATARFSPDGRQVVTAGADSRAHLYRCEVCAPLGDLLALARTRTTRALTAEERRRYLPEGAT